MELISLQSLDGSYVSSSRLARARGPTGQRTKEMPRPGARAEWRDESGVLRFITFNSPSRLLAASDSRRQVSGTEENCHRLFAHLNCGEYVQHEKISSFCPFFSRLKQDNFYRSDCSILYGLNIRQLPAVD
jgi:hypothetical protein